MVPGECKIDTVDVYFGPPYCLGQFCSWQGGDAFQNTFRVIYGGRVIYGNPRRNGIHSNGAVVYTISTLILSSNER